VILFDTSVLSQVLRRRRQGPRERRLLAAFERLMQGDASLGLPGIVLQEVLSGLPSERACRELRSKLLGAFTIVLATVDDHLEAARLKNLCISKGSNVSGVDCLIAATAIAGGHELFTTDSDFHSLQKHSSLKLFEELSVARGR
jgi:predicted nucleic acid-binding protein